MSSPEVTITLGRSRQVVKRKWANLAGKLSDSHQSSVLERPRSNGGSSFLSDGKRWRGIAVEGNMSSNSNNDMVFDRKDLRYDLIRMRLSRETQSVAATANEWRTKLKQELYIGAARSSMSSCEAGYFLKVPYRETAIDLPYVDSSRNYLNSIRCDLRVRSSGRSMRTSRSLSPPVYKTGMQKALPIRSINASGVQHVFSNTIIEPSMSAAPAHRTSLTGLGASRPLTLLPALSGIMPRSSSMVKAPVTVAGFLNSLGLGKYVIHFQAEEVDMTALKQMDEKDLKVLGLPMGPRKKVLQALSALYKRQLPRQP